MEIICIFNGLGNQMSQYAFYLAKKAQNDKGAYYLNLADSFYEIHNGYELSRCFNIPEDNEIPLIIKWFSKYRFSNKHYSIKRFLCKILTKTIRENHDYRYNSKIAKRHYCNIYYYISGWHSMQYYKTIENRVKEVFQFDLNKLDENNQIVLHEIESSNSISIHIRRGDYVNNPDFEGICTEDYYAKAIVIMKKLLQINDDLHFYIFSDDTGYAKKLFKGTNFTTIDYNTGINSWIDMCLMSKCKHNINANSTFSWWAAWLNANPNKIVIAPQQFLNGRETSEFYPETWIKI